MMFIVMYAYYVYIQLAFVSIICFVNMILILDKLTPYVSTYHCVLFLQCKYTLCVIICT